jgi:hypothetical protein
MASALLVVALGCEGGGGMPSTDSSTAEAKVSGKVTVNGKVASKGKVTFDPANVRRKDAKSTTVDISKDGAYSVTTLVGENRVIVDTPEIRADSAKLSNGETSYNATAGDNTFDITFPLAK